MGVADSAVLNAVQLESTTESDSTTLPSFSPDHKETELGATKDVVCSENKKSALDTFKNSKGKKHVPVPSISILSFFADSIYSL